MISESHFFGRRQARTLSLPPFSSGLIRTDEKFALGAVPAAFSISD